jgi:hypothetical protein
MDMPVIAKFYGVVIRMLFLRSFGPRFDALHQDGELVVNITPLMIIEGDAPEPVRRLVLDWARQHQMELLTVWHRLSRARRPMRTPA